MQGLRDYPDIPDFMTGLKSLTMVKIGNLKEPCDCGHFRCSPHGREIYTTTSRSGKGVPLVSLGGIDFAKTPGRSAGATTRSFAELKIIDFEGGSASEDVERCWDVGPETLGWKLKCSTLSKKAHLGPGKRCVRSSRWFCETRKRTNVWYAI